MLDKRIPQRTKIYFILAVATLIVVGTAIACIVIPPEDL